MTTLQAAHYKENCTTEELREALDDLRTNQALALEANQEAQFDKTTRLIEVVQKELETR